MLNADNLAKLLYPVDPESNSYIASQLIGGMRETMLAEGYNFCFETVFSHPSKIDFIAKARSYGYEVVLVYIHVSTPGLNLARVSQRVSEGGHNVPEEKVLERVKRLVPLVNKAIPLCDQVRFYDNSSLQTPHNLVQIVVNNAIDYRVKNPPDWLDLFSVN